MKRYLVLVVVGMLVALTGCGGGGSESSEGYGAQSGAERQQLRQQEVHRRAVLRHRGQVAARRRAARHARFLVYRERREEARQLRLEERELEEAPEEEPAPEESSECDPNYTGACLSPTASDYDCAGGSGNGPEYTGTVTVVGEDHYGLDSDGDGTGCEG